MSIYYPEPLGIPDLDTGVYRRIKNKLPVSVENANTLDANRVMFLLDCILSGEYRSRPAQWTMATRPTPAGTPAVQNGEIGFNTDINGLEMYTGAVYKWSILFGIWTIDTQPMTDIAPGSRGFCLGIGPVIFDGSQWNAG